jgi:hypothetical protein
MERATISRTALVISGAFLNAATVASAVFLAVSSTVGFGGSWMD